MGAETAAIRLTIRDNSVSPSTKDEYEGSGINYIIESTGMTFDFRTKIQVTQIHRSSEVATITSRGVGSTTTKYRDHFRIMWKL